jgi:hypothetical protein
VEKDRTKLLVESTLLEWKKFGAMLPSLREWSDKVRCEYDSIIEGHLCNKSRPAVRSADEVKKAFAKARESKKEAERLAAQLAIYESQGFKVHYHGALEGREDLGIDLVCSKNGHTHIIQCKRLSEQKGIPVRENVIAQVYGSALFYAMEKHVKEMPTALLITTYECSEMARKFAKHLGVVLREKFLFQPYPCIKCNISRATGEKIYHLPFDQQYDKTSIGDVEGDFYANSIIEAEAAGFRRAFRWTGNS